MKCTFAKPEFRSELVNEEERYVREASIFSGVVIEVTDDFGNNTLAKAHDVQSLLCGCDHHLDH